MPKRARSSSISDACISALATPASPLETLQAIATASAGLDGAQSEASSWPPACDLDIEAFHAARDGDTHASFTSASDSVADASPSSATCSNGDTSAEHGLADISRFYCSVLGCGASFTRAQSLKRHACKHTGEKPYRCTFEGCDAAFAESGKLTSHMRTHTGEKPYRCTFEGCDAAFAKSGGLSTHIRTHTGEKPYRCTFEGCDAAFAQSGELTKHMRTHTGEKPYRCTFEGCDAAFAQSGGLTKHMRTHTGEKPYRCTFEGCDAAFAESGNRTTHYISQHTPEGQARQKKQEQRLARALDAAGVPYKREHRIDFSCMGATNCRIDFLVLLANGVLVMLECDEHQHSDTGYSCDLRRMAYVREALTIEGNTLPLVFLRYNPDAFKVGGVTRPTKKKDREARLVALLRDLEVRDATGLPPMTLQYLYYDVTADCARNTLWDEADEENRVMQQICSLPIIE